MNDVGQIVLMVLAFGCGYLSCKKAAHDKVDANWKSLVRSDFEYVRNNIKYLSEIVDFDLKIESKYYDQILDGTKTFEVRKEDDKHFRAGDIILLHEIDENKEPVGNTICVNVTNVFRDTEYCLEGSAILSVCVISNYELRRRWLIEVPEKVKVLYDSKSQ